MVGAGRLQCQAVQIGDPDDEETPAHVAGVLGALMGFGMGSRRYDYMLRGFELHRGGDHR